MRFMVLGFLALAACSSAPVEGTLDAGAGNVGDAATNKVCGPPPGGAPSENARCVRDVAGVITDDRGSPVRDLTITVCGVVCFAALSDGAGAFRVPVDAHLPEGGYAMTANGRPTLGGTYLRLPEMAEGNVRLPKTLVLPRFSSETARLPDDGAAGLVRSGPLTLDVREGTSWELDIEDLTDEVEGRKLRQAEVGEGARPDFAAGAARVFALGPFKAKPSKPVGVVITNAGLPAGTKVSFVVMTDSSSSITNDAGKGKVVAKGSVSADGTTIRTDEGEGIDRLTWLAVVPER